MSDEQPGWVKDEHNSDIEHRGGIAWHAAPPPERRGHEHFGWSRMWQGLDGLERCPCGAMRYLSRPSWAWFYASDREEQEARWAPEPVDVVTSAWRRLVSSVSSRR